MWPSAFTSLMIKQLLHIIHFLSAPPISPAFTCYGLLGLCFLSLPLTSCQTQSAYPTQICCQRIIVCKSSVRFIAKAWCPQHSAPSGDSGEELNSVIWVKISSMLRGQGLVCGKLPVSRTILAAEGHLVGCLRVPSHLQSQSQQVGHLQTQILLLLWSHLNDTIPLLSTHEVILDQIILFLVCLALSPSAQSPMLCEAPCARVPEIKGDEESKGTRLRKGLFYQEIGLNVFSFCCYASSNQTPGMRLLVQSDFSLGCQITNNDMETYY